MDKFRRIALPVGLSGFLLLLVANASAYYQTESEVVGEVTPMEFFIQGSKYRKTAFLCVGATKDKSTNEARICFSKTNGRHNHTINGSITTDQSLSSVSRCEDLGYCNNELKVAMYINDRYSLIRVPVRNDQILEVPVSVTRSLNQTLRKTKDPVTTLRVVTKNNEGARLSYVFAIDTQAFIDFTKTFK